MTLIDRRAIIGAALALLAGCAQGKLEGRVAFLLPDESRDALTQALRTFALHEGFKFAVQEQDLDLYILLTSGDVDISCQPRAPGEMPLGGAPVPSEPVAEIPPAESPESAAPQQAEPSPPPSPRVSPVRYEAWFFAHGDHADAATARVARLKDEFSRALGTVPGVRKVAI